MTTIAADEREALQRMGKVVDILKEWAQWSKGYRLKIGYPQKSAGFDPSGGVVTADTSDEQAEDSQAWRCNIVDRCIDDLDEPAQRAAIHHCYLHAVYRMRDYEGSLLRAHEELLVALPRKGVLW